MNGTQALIDQIVEHRKAEAAKHAQVQEGLQKDDKYFTILAELLDALAEMLTSHTQKVRVTNQQSKVEVKGPVVVPQLDVVNDSLDTIDDSIKDSIDGLETGIVTELQRDHKVEVTNFPEQLPFPEIVIPERVTAEIDTLPPYVAEGFNALLTAIKGLKLAPKIEVNQPAPVVNVELGVVTAKLNELLTVLTEFSQKEAITVEKPDFTGLEDMIYEMKVVLEAVRENTSLQTTQTHLASWDKSLHQQSLDAAASTVYKTVATKKVTDYLQFTDQHGIIWRKTFTYDVEGDVISWTAWTQQ